MRLSDAALRDLPPDVLRPAYDRAAVLPGVVHLGIGAFFRTHGAVAIDDCLAAGERGWGIAAASLRSPATRDALAPQDGLYTLALRDRAGERLRVIGAIGALLVAPEAPDRLLAALTDPRTRIVTLTVTEKGYLIDVACGRLRDDHPDLLHDLAHPDHPRSAPGFLVEALRRRRRAGIAPFTILSCDNLRGNGRTLARVLGDVAARRDDDLRGFIEAEVSCPSTMVDRIVPATTDADRTGISARLGAEDAWPVVGEPFFQWVIEDRFPLGRPDLERGGAEFVANVTPYEDMKLRLLNGAHSTLAAVGRLLGFETVAEAMADEDVAAFLDRYWIEVVPTLDLPAVQARRYTDRLVERFGNPALRHRLDQIATDASLKLPPRILAPLRDRLAEGFVPPALVLAVAAWMRGSGGRDEAGRDLALADPPIEAWAGRPDPGAVSPGALVDAYLGLAAVFGPDLPRDARFVDALRTVSHGIARSGVRAAIRQTLAAPGDAR